MLLKDIIKIGVETVSSLYPEREAREMVFAYMEEAEGTRRHTYIIEPEYEIDESKVNAILEAFRQMSEGKPLQYITGKAHFYGRTFTVTPDVLIPRPETEILVDQIVKSFPQKRPLRILDLCTGSGCIAWTLALALPGSEVVAVDISEAALKVASSQDASEEIALTGALAPQFIQADILKESLPVSGSFDVIVSNPPYVTDSEKALMRTNVLDHEPHLALFVPDDDPLRFYKAIARHSRNLLSEKGTGLVEINEAFGNETAEVFTASGFCTEVIQDLSGRERFVRFDKETCI